MAIALPGAVDTMGVFSMTHHSVRRNNTRTVQTGFPTMSGSSLIGSLPRGHVQPDLVPLPTGMVRPGDVS